MLRGAAAAAAVAACRLMGRTYEEAQLHASRLFQVLIAALTVAIKVPDCIPDEAPDQMDFIVDIVEAKPARTPVLTCCDGIVSFSGVAISRRRCR